MDHIEFEAKRNALFTELLSATWNKRGETQNFKEKKIWQHIKEKVLTAAPALEGSEYQNSNSRIMFVGRALNGWEIDFGDCLSLESTVDSVVNQKNDDDNGLGTFVNSKGYDGYFHINSKFFRFIKHVLENLDESQRGINETFYDKDDKWNQKFVWANLYCIAPRTGGNPPDSLVKSSIKTYIELIKLYIEYYNPTNVVFITDLNWFGVDTEKSQDSFLGIFDSENDYTTKDLCYPIVLEGNVNNSKIIVCKRPDYFGASYDKVENMASVVANHCRKQR